MKRLLGAVAIAVLLACGGGNTWQSCCMALNGSTMKPEEARASAATCPVEAQTLITHCYGS